jgi:hypothetical protein
MRFSTVPAQLHRTSPMRLRFTIRDLLWLALLAAVGAGWYIDHYNIKAKLESRAA